MIETHFILLLPFQFGHIQHSWTYWLGSRSGSLSFSSIEKKNKPIQIGTLYEACYCFT